MHRIILEDSPANLSVKSKHHGLAHTLLGVCLQDKQNTHQKYIEGWRVMLWVIYLRCNHTWYLYIALYVGDGAISTNTLLTFNNITT